MSPTSKLNKNDPVIWACKTNNLFSNLFSETNLRMNEIKADGRHFISYTKRVGTMFHLCRKKHVTIV
jgi:hypothetical protein